MNGNKNIILEKSFNFSLKILELYKVMKVQNEFIISKQILRCGILELRLRLRLRLRTMGA